VKRECKTCEWCSLEEHPDGRILSLCRIRPPEVREIDGKFRSFWPIVEDFDWCGQWRPKKNE
jgi:hypothetical protein